MDSVRALAAGRAKFVPKESVRMIYGANVVKILATAMQTIQTCVTHGQVCANAKPAGLVKIAVGCVLF